MQISVAQGQMFFLALTRVLAMMIHVPVLGGHSVPNPVKIGLGFVLTLIMLPWQGWPAESTAIALMPFTFAIGRELLLGTLAGFAAVLTFGAIQVAGNLMGLGSGFSAGQILNPAIDVSGSALDQIFVMTAFLIFLVTNAHHAFLIGVQRTFEIFPLQASLSDIPMQALISQTGGLITAGIQMALPVMGTLLLTDLTLGLLARVAPQIQVFFLGIPLKVGVGLLALALAMTILLPAITDLFHTLGERTLTLIGA